MLEVLTGFYVVGHAPFPLTCSLPELLNMRDGWSKGAGTLWAAELGEEVVAWSAAC